MAISYANTTEIQNIANDLISLADELNLEINNLFTRFSDVPTVTKEWVGDKSVFYFNFIASDKKQYNDFAAKLKDIGYKLSMNSYEIQNCIKKNIDIES